MSVLNAILVLAAAACLYRLIRWAFSPPYVPVADEMAEPHGDVPSPHREFQGDIHV